MKKKGVRMDLEGGGGDSWQRWRGGRLGLALRRHQSLTSGSVGWRWEPRAGIKCSGQELSLSVSVT